MRFMSFAAQAGGHEGAFRKMRDGRLMKITCPAETAFYSSLVRRNLPENIGSFFPSFHGIGSIKGRGTKFNSSLCITWLI